MSSQTRSTSTSPIYPQNPISLELLPSKLLAPASINLSQIATRSLEESGQVIKRAKTGDNVSARLLRHNACTKIEEHFNRQPGQPCSGCMPANQDLFLSPIQITTQGLERTEEVENPAKEPVKIESSSAQFLRHNESDNSDQILFPAPPPVPALPRPKPNIHPSNWDFASTMGIMKTPPSPCKQSRQTLTSHFCIKALRILSEYKINKEGQRFNLHILKGMSGDHSQIYAIQDPIRLIPEADNNDILIKIFHEHLIYQMSNDVEDVLLTNSLQQYDELSQTHLATCTIYNRATAHIDGYLIVEKLQPFIPSWKGLEPLKESDRPLLEQVKQFFDYAFNSKSPLPLDLQIQNFGIKADGRLALLDFMERKEDISSAFELIAKKCMISLSNGNREVYEELRNLVRERNPRLYDRLNID